MLTRDSVLFYFDAMYGIDPVVGGDPNFVRDAAGWYFDGRMYRKALPGTPRINRIFDFDEGLGPRPTLALEPGVTQRLDDPHRPGHPDSWSQVGGTWSEVASVFGADGVAFKMDADGFAGRRCTQAFGAGGGVMMAVAVVESGTAAKLRVGVRDEVANSWVGLAEFTPDAPGGSTGTIVGGAGSAGALALADRGPNGGQLVLCWLRVSSTSNVGLWVYPNGGDAASTFNFVHYAGVANAEHVWTPFIGNAGSTTNADRLDFSIGQKLPKPEPLTILAEYFSRLHNDLWSANYVAVEIGAGADRWLLYYGGGVLRSWINNSGANTDIGTTLVPGQRRIRHMSLLESAAIRTFGQRGDEAPVVNGANITMPANWSGEPWLSVGMTHSGSSFTPLELARLMIVRTGDFDAVTGSGVTDALLEAADLYLGPNGEVL